MCWWTHGARVSAFAGVGGTGEDTGLRLTKAIGCRHGKGWELTCEQGILQAIGSKAHSVAEVAEGCSAPIAGQEHVVSCQAAQGRGGTGESRPRPALDFQ